MQLPVQPDRFGYVRRQFIGAHGTFGQHNAIFQNTSERMLARMAVLSIKPDRVLDLGCRNGYQFDALQRRFPDAQVIGADPASIGSSIRWWQRKPKTNPTLTADPHHLPFEDGSFDLVVCSHRSDRIRFRSTVSCGAASIRISMYSD